MDFTNQETDKRQTIPAPTSSADSQIHVDQQVLSLKLRLTQATMCHEYARLEYDRTVCLMRRGELQEEMSLYHETYQEARTSLYMRHPEVLVDLESELRSQKQRVFNGSEVH